MKNATSETNVVNVHDGQGHTVAADILNNTFFVRDYECPVTVCYINVLRPTLNSGNQFVGVASLIDISFIKFCSAVRKLRTGSAAVFCAAETPACLQVRLR